MTTPSDPLFPSQWHFNLIGDINAIWNEYTGDGVNIGVYGNGIQSTHSDLDDNYNSTLGVVDTNGTLILQTPNLINNAAQGTAAAGIIAAEKNGGGTVGLAYNASITGVNILDPAIYGYLHYTTSAEQSAFESVINQASSFDVMSNTWSNIASFDLSRSKTAPDSIDYLYLEQIKQNLAEGRQGLGTVVVQAVGDDGIDANGSSINSSRFTVSVAATDNNGFATELTNFGSSILISAPTAAVTTDLIGNDGLNASGTSEPTGPDALLDTDYTSVFGNTPAANSVVSGVIALMLNANENLGWRDIQNILAISAAHTGSEIATAATGFERGDWVFNGATNWNGGGMSVNGSYGYGIIDAFTSVRMAEAWSKLNSSPLTSVNEQVGASATTDFGEGLAIFTNGAEVDFTISSAVNLSIEHLQLNLDFEHAFIGDMKVFLTDPNNHKIQLVYQSDVPTSFSGTWSYGVDSFLGVSSVGDWTVSVSDAFPLSDNGTLFGGSIDFFGATTTTDNIHHFTADFLDYAAVDPARSVITDTDGGQDWLNFAAIADNVKVSLLPDSFFSVNGLDWGRLSSGSEQFENVITGDGNDIITGNSLANELHGMRGNDTLFGGAGADTLNGGAGNDVLFGGSGIDFFTGGDGNDIFFIDETNEIISGGSGTDTARIDSQSGITITMAGWTGVERVDGADGNDTISAIGQTVPLLLIGGDGDDTLFAGSIGSTLQGGSGNDTLTGGTGNDTLFGGVGNDQLFGGIGNDLIFVEDDGDVVNGGAGSDWVRISNSEGANIVVGGWIAIERIDGDIGNDTIDASGNTTGLLMFGRNGDDHLTGGSGQDFLFGDDGSDTIIGGGGIDVLDGGAGADNLSGGAGDDMFFIDNAGDLVNGGAGLDRARIANGVVGIDIDISSWIGIERFNASIGNDTINGSGNAEDLVINGNMGDDLVIGGLGSDLLFGGSGNDSIAGGSGQDFLFGDAGADTFSGGAGDDFFYIDDPDDIVTDGGAGTDRVVIVKAGIIVTLNSLWTNIERIDGAAGAEIIDASAQTNVMSIIGNAGNDRLIGGNANDVLFGNDGVDTLIGNAGNDQLFGGGNDGDADVFIFSDGFGTDVIRDWEDGFDRMDFSTHTGINSIDDITIDQSSGINTVISFGTESITLRDFTGITGIDDFIF